MKYTPAQQPSINGPPLEQKSLIARIRLPVVGIVILLTFGYFGFTAFQGATSYYLTVDEVVERGVTVAEGLQVKGRLVSDSFSREAADGSGPTTFATFLMEENGHQITASFEGALPALFFNPHSEIVLNGAFGEDGVFAANRVLVKCPSKYRSLEVELPEGYGNPS